MLKQREIIRTKIYDAILVSCKNLNRIKIDVCFNHIFHGFRFWEEYLRVYLPSCLLCKSYPNCNRYDIHPAIHVKLRWRIVGRFEPLVVWVWFSKNATRYLTNSLTDLGIGNAINEISFSELIPDNLEVVKCFYNFITIARKII